MLFDFYHFRGSHPNAPVVDVNGTLYGTTSTGGKYRHGTVYSITPGHGHATLHAFGATPDGADPRGGLTYANGTLYGTTWGGGTSDNGTVFSITPSGSESVLYSFAGGSDGAKPVSNLVDVNGTLYGITNEGGDACNSYTLGCGTVYSISTSGAHQVLHSFTSSPDGAFPYAGLIDVNGTLYGTTAAGGGTCNNFYNPCGTVYSISASGSEKVIYRFKGGTDGAQPQATLIDVKGKLYGTTTAGGGNGCDFTSQKLGCGTVFGVTTAGKESVLYRFAGNTDGADPMVGVTALNGVLYGTTWNGGATCSHALCGWGTIYSVTMSGVEHILYTFGGSNGEIPGANLIEMNGALYGTTVFGGVQCVHNGAAGCGTVFELSQ